MKTYNFTHLFYFKSLRGASIGFTIISFVLHIIYYGSEYSISSITEGNAIYILGGVMGIVELLSTLVIQFSISKLPRRKAMIGSMVMSIVFCSCFLSFGWREDSTKTDCSLCAKCKLYISYGRNIRNRSIWISANFQYIWFRNPRTLCQ